MPAVSSAAAAGYGSASAAPTAPAAAPSAAAAQTEEDERKSASASTSARGGGPASQASERQVAVSRSSGRRPSGSGGSDGGRHGEQAAAAAAGTASASNAVASSPGAGDMPAPMNNYAFFVKYTYSNECALLAYNFHELVTKLRIFERFAYRNDHRLISVTLAYIFYRYQVHHCDMALDLAVTLVYLEDVREQETVLPEQNRDAFNLICYLAFLAHAFNADRTIRLSDWYKEIGWRSFRSCQQLNGYVFLLFSEVRRFRLRVSESRVKRYIQKLCSVPSQIHGDA